MSRIRSYFYIARACEGKCLHGVDRGSCETNLRPMRATSSASAVKAMDDYAQPSQSYRHARRVTRSTAERYGRIIQA